MCIGSMFYKCMFAHDKNGSMFLMCILLGACSSPIFTCLSGVCLVVSVTLGQRRARFTMSCFISMFNGPMFSKCIFAHNKNDSIFLICIFSPYVQRFHVLKFLKFIFLPLLEVRAATRPSLKLLRRAGGLRPPARALWALRMLFYNQNGHII